MHKNNSHSQFLFLACVQILGLLLYLYHCHLKRGREEVNTLQAHPKYCYLIITFTAEKKKILNTCNQSHIYVMDEIKDETI